MTESGAPSERGARARTMALIALSGVLLIGVLGRAAADTARFRDQARDNTGGGAHADLIKATQGHVHGRSHRVMHDVTVRNLGPRDTWPWLVIDLGSAARFFIDPTFERGHLFAVGPHGVHAAPVVPLDHDTLRYEFKIQWLDEGPVDQYCWSFLTPIDNERSHDAMPDSVGAGSVSGTQGGYRHLLRDTDVSCRP